MSSKVLEQGRTTIIVVHVNVMPTILQTFKQLEDNNMRHTNIICIQGSIFAFMYVYVYVNVKVHVGVY